MPRLRRLLLNTLTLISFLICAAATTLWIRSHFACDQLKWNTSSGGLVVFPLPTELAICTAHLGHSPDPPRFTYQRLTPDDGRTQVQTQLAYLRRAPQLLRAQSTEWQRAGVAYTSLHRAGLGIHLLRLPYWPLIPMTALLPAVRLFSFPNRRRRARAAQGLCPHCGYDLRATPTRCPECGAIPQPST
jgi:hypothetical protein